MPCRFILQGLFLRAVFIYYGLFLVNCFLNNQVSGIVLHNPFKIILLQFFIATLRNLFFFSS